MYLQFRSLLTQLPEQADHFKSRDGRFGALVTSLGARTLDSLFDGIHRQHTKGHRYVRIKAYRADTA